MGSAALPGQGGGGPAKDWAAATGVADRQGGKQGLWRTMGALNALPGQVTYEDGYVVVREKVVACYRRLVRAYPGAERAHAIRDNGSIYKLAEGRRAVRDRVRQFLDQFAHGSPRLLGRVGLLDNGLVARMIHGP